MVESLDLFPRNETERGKSKEEFGHREMERDIGDMILESQLILRFFVLWICDGSSA